jgi:phosphate-selective porin OprO/OprP
MDPTRSGAALACAFAAWALAGAARADELDDLKRAVAEQQERVERLEREREHEAQAAPLVAGWEEGFFLGSADGKNKLELRGYLQVDGSVFPDDDELPLDNQLVMRRVRPIFEGSLLGFVDFRLMPDFGRGTTELYDAYVNARMLGEKGETLQLQAGRFKPPVGLERLQSATALSFNERALPTELVPNRDIGVMVHGLGLLGGRLDYQAGVFDGARDGRSVDGNTSDAFDLAARLFGHPLKGTGVAALEGLGLGVAGSWGHQGPDDPLPAFRAPASQASFFSFLAGVVPDGDRTRLSPQLYWSWGPVGLLGEYVVSSQRVELGAESEWLTHHAWQSALAVVLTGEPASFRGVTPSRPFDTATWGPGAWELVARVHQLDVDDDAFPIFASPTASAEEAFAWAAGVNWYWNRWVKVAVSWEETAFDGGAASGDRETERGIQTRFQLAF